MRLPCDPADWTAFSRALDDLLEAPAGERENRLAGLAGERPELARALATVLAADSLDSRAGAMFAADPLAAVGSSKTSGVDSAAGNRVGPWRLERELGCGGMGSVWLARRADGAHGREVALKLPHAHLVGEVALARFRRERDVLAALAHPAIAGLLDAGVGEDGRPWLALERVDGIPITDACRRDGLDILARVALVETIAGAVAAAHARLVVHRDIKPSNVLVAADGRPVLLDFGIAKLLAPGTGGGEIGPPAAAALTVEGARLVTPDYAAPEQLDGGAITVATDVYALGLLLFELLTGRLPHPRGRRLAELGVDGEPLRASAAVEPAHAASVGGLDACALARRIAGDLDAILGRALDPDPAARYSSAEAFAEDLGRYRRGEPIRARRTPRRVRWAKFVRRHRSSVGLAAALVVATVVGVGAVLSQNLATAREAERANATRDFLIDVLRAADPRIERDRPPGELSARGLLALGIARLERDRRLDPVTRADLTDLFATLHAYLDETASARALARENRQGLAARLAPAEPELLDARAFEVWLALQAEDLAAAEAMLAELDRDLAEFGLDRSRHRAEWHLATADLAGARGERGRRRAELEAATALYERSDPADRGYAAALANLSALRLEDGDAAAALALADTAHQRVLRAGADTGTELARIAARRGEALLELGRNREALEAFHEARRRFAGTVGSEHASAWPATAGLALAAARLGDEPTATQLRLELEGASGWNTPANRALRVEAERLLARDQAPARVASAVR